jgi:homogentisate 1,2-dioxygenase
MFESRCRLRPTAWAMQPPRLDAAYAGCWAALADRFDPNHDLRA